MFNSHEFPFITEANPTLPAGYVTTSAWQFVEDFYACKFEIAVRDTLPAYIHHLILQNKDSPAPDDQKALLCLQFIYICLTQLHFHVTCTCGAYANPKPGYCWENRRHNYYDHLYDLFRQIRKFGTSYNFTMQNDWKDFFVGIQEPIQISMAITCLPWLYLILRNTQDYDVLMGFAGQIFGTQQLTVNEAAYIATFGVSKKAGMRRLYVRYVAQNRSQSNSSIFIQLNLLRTGYRFSLSDYDFRGCDFAYVHGPNTLEEYSEPTMTRVDFRNSTWMHAAMFDLPRFSQSVETAIFQGAYITNSDGQTPGAIADQLAKLPLLFPPLTNNSCFFRVLKQSGCIIL